MTNVATVLEKKSFNLGPSQGILFFCNPIFDRIYPSLPTLGKVGLWGTEKIKLQLTIGLGDRVDEVNSSFVNLKRMSCNETYVRQLSQLFCRRLYVSH